jgi:2,3-bisphosphoglycerate-independent phosphoglycerate mutase
VRPERDSPGPINPGRDSPGPVSPGRRPVALVVLDGWGWAPDGPGNAVTQANTPFLDGLLAHYPWVLLGASGEAVGLPEGVMGNSEVGHLTLGSGRIVYQDLSRINHAVQDGSFYDNHVLVPAFRAAAAEGRTVHLMGLLSDGGVHADIEHVKALVRLAHRLGVARLYLHPFMDGRDTSPTHGQDLMRALLAFLHQQGIGEVATVHGRYYPMDRDRRWERTKRAWDALVHGAGRRSPDPLTAVTSSYSSGITDEFIEPTVIIEEAGARVKDGDTVVFYNFRPDRARQLSRAFIQPDFVDFDRGPAPPQVSLLTMTEYDASFGVPVIFSDVEPRDVLAEVLSRHGMSQLHIAETEKYAHVTFFFNGGREEAFAGEQRRLIPSPTDVPTYDKKPEMSCHQVTSELLELLEQHAFDFMIVNFANADMVGHSGDLRATMAALEHVDSCVARVVAALQKKRAHIFVTADHGNAEQMMDAEGSPNTAHTTNPVPLVYLEEGGRLKEGMGLADIAPTVLCLLGIPQPPEMTGVPVCEV